jgi:hypothetical protein
MRFHLTKYKVIRLPGALPFRAEPNVDYALDLAASGTWAEADQALTARDGREWAALPDDRPQEPLTR